MISAENQVNFVCEQICSKFFTSLRSWIADERDMQIYTRVTHKTVGYLGDFGQSADATCEQTCCPFCNWNQRLANRSAGRAHLEKQCSQVQRDFLDQQRLTAARSSRRDVQWTRHRPNWSKSPQKANNDEHFKSVSSEIFCARNSFISPSFQLLECQWRQAEGVLGLRELFAHLEVRCS